METVRILIAILLLWLPWSGCLAVLIPRNAPGRVSLVAGYGMLTGLLMIPLIMRMLHFAGIPLSFSTIAISSLLMSAGLWFISRKRFPIGAISWAADETSSFKPGWANVLLVLIAFLIAARVGSVVLEVLSRPLFAWDATMHWATKTRVWFEYREILPFVDRELWLQAGNSLIFTDEHPGYPKTIPLLQTWMLLALGRWDESIMNLPWLVCYFAIGLIFYGQIRYARANRLTALAMTYMLLSLPLLNTHVALAGYADLFMAASYGAAVMAFYHWSVTRESWQGLLAVAFIAACLLIKNEGLFWLISLLPGFIISVFSRRRAVAMIGAAAAFAAALLFLVPSDLEIAGHTLQQLNLHFRPESLGPFFTSLFVMDNWHFLPYLFVTLLFVSLSLSSRVRNQLAASSAVIISALCFYLFLYLFTRHSYGAVNYTSVARIGLQLMPAIAFVTAIAWLLLLEQFSGDSVPDNRRISDSRNQR